MGEIHATLITPPHATQFSQASLRCSPVNIRKGPGLKHPLTWILLCKGAPIKIKKSFGTWRKICDALGSEGWVHVSMLSPAATVMVTAPSCVLRTADHYDAAGQAVLRQYVVCHVLQKKATWYQVHVKGLRGWIPAKDVWG